MCKIDLTHTLMRRLREADVERLGMFFARNDRPEVTRFFNPFPLNNGTAKALLKPTRKDQFFTIEENGRFLGFSMLRGYDEGYEIPVFGIFVDWEHQGCGLGKKLTEWTLRWADLRGVAKIRLSVFENNTRGRELYDRLGFIKTGRRKDPSGCVGVIMHRTRPTPPTMVFASTEALPKNEALRDRCRRWFDAGIHHIELSNDDVGDEREFLASSTRFPGKLLIHHFFPAGRGDLVLNLASEDPRRRHETTLFFKRSIAWSAEIGAPFFSFHAGYVTDPIGRDRHGFVFAEPTPGAYEAACNRFTAEVEALANLASEYGMVLLIENNVVSVSHRDKLFLSTPEEFMRFLKQSVAFENVGILLDWGHWLVTADTYSLALDSFLSLHDRIYGIHLHLNDGQADEHLPFPPDHPHLPLLRRFNPDFVTLEGHYQSLSLLQHDILSMEKAFA